MMLLQGDCLEKLKELSDNSVDSIVTDPPAGIAFMNKSWDSDKGGRDHWIAWLTEIMIECKRVLKPGGHALVWGLPRTSHWTATAIENAGFEVRDICMHIFGSGFPKSHNLKGEHEGKGTALKPAAEHWILARKPLEKGLTIAENVVKWGTGALNIDASRIDGAGLNWTRDTRGQASITKNTYGEYANSLKKGNAQGRWPANILFDEEAASVLDLQSGIVKSGGNTNCKGGFNKQYVGGDSASANKVTTTLERGSGGASRFFYCAKASKSERNAGLEGMQKKVLATSNHGQEEPVSGRLGANPLARQEPVANHHPTVKPIKLMEYLITLVTPPGGIILDPFMGSGSTGVAARNLNREFIGCELNEEYFEIAKKRIG